VILLPCSFTFGSVYYRFFFSATEKPSLYFPCTYNSLQRGRFCLDYPEVAHNDWLHLSPGISDYEKTSEYRPNYVTWKGSERLLKKKACIKDRITKAYHQAEGK
jgi:hypothetical protein